MPIPCRSNKDVVEVCMSQNKGDSKIFQNLNPLISVIVPTYNSAKSLASCIDSLAHQTTSNFEVIVSDDGSTDDTPVVVEALMDKFPIRFLRGPHSGGPARPRNRAAESAAGTILTFIDSDDTAAPDRLAEIESVEPFEWDIIYHPLQRRTRFKPLLDGSKLVGQKPILGDPFRYLLDYGNPIALSGASVRKTKFEELGGFDESAYLHGLEDFDFWLRAARSGARFAHLEKILGEYHESKNQLSKSFEVKSNLLFLVDRYREEINFTDNGKSAWVHFGISRMRLVDTSLLRSVSVISRFASQSRNPMMILRLSFFSLVTNLIKSRDKLFQTLGSWAPARGRKD